MAKQGNRPWWFASAMESNGFLAWQREWGRRAEPDRAVAGVLHSVFSFPITVSSKACNIAHDSVCGECIS